MSTPGGVRAQPSGAAQRLRIDPGSIDGAIQAFNEALESVRHQLNRLRSAHQQPWAGDPVSSETAQAVNGRTGNGTEEFSAENVLAAYAQQLSNVVDGLRRTKESYLATDENAAQMMRKHARG